jgi:hypothetical protein
MRGREMKRALIDTIVAVMAVCPDCHVPCENDSGSQMIESEQKVSCPVCHQGLAVPQSAFRVRQKSKRDKAE